MKRVIPAVLAGSLLALAACQGGFGGSTAAPGGITPPVNGQGPQGPVPGVSPQANGTAAAAASPAASPSAASYAFADAPRGLKCPPLDGYSCTLAFNITSTPAPSPGPSSKATATPSPSPTPAPSSSASGSPSPSPTPSGPHIVLAAASLPKDAPKMLNPDPKAIATIALMSVRLHIDQDVVLDGRATADFTLPKEQIGGRGFAVQFFHEVPKHHGVDDQFVASYSQSKLKNGSTLHFEFAPPKIQLKKNDTWMLVLYGDELPEASASPSASPSSSASPAAAATPSAAP